MKEISELAVAVGQDAGFQPDTINAGKDKDSLSLSALSAKEALEDIKQRNMQVFLNYIWSSLKYVYFQRIVWWKQFS